MRAALFATPLCLALCLVPSLAAAKQVTASIDHRCQSRAAKLVVPAGRRALGFRVVRLENGTRCVTGGKPDNRGFSIKKRLRFVYRYSQFKRQRPTEHPVRLGRLVLQPGTHWVHVGGGKGARVVLSYSLR